MNDGIHLDGPQASALTEAVELFVRMLDNRGLNVHITQEVTLEECQEFLDLVKPEVRR